MASEQWQKLFKVKPLSLAAPAGRASKDKNAWMKSCGGQTRKEQLGTEGYQELGSIGRQTSKVQIGIEGYKEMGKKGGPLSTSDRSGGERAAEEGIPIVRVQV